MSKSNVYRGGEVHVMAERCSTCIFRPGNLMMLQPGRVRRMVRKCARKPSGNIPCHDTISGRYQAICRGFWDGPGQLDPLLTLANSLGIVTYDERSNDGNDY